ncbi:MAG: hypothetical protein DI598_16990 [Pseudopedobacter saltans]|uniref:MtN3 and saliva related transmembrane protein n=1 Tax=Pseudopedobacter saltans TaxID=151895 RepID=A0A2W5EK64_9SPHI|nr:MAG: hypothetical protein DI598_16990 [Pseudopedobacter saltans]
MWLRSKMQLMRYNSIYVIKKTLSVLSGKHMPIGNMVNPKIILLPSVENLCIKPKYFTMSFTQIIGFIATILSIATYMPQVFQLYKTKSARDISMPMLLLLCFGVAIWLTFGIWIKDIPLILTNGLILTMSLLMVIMKLKYDKKIKS